MNEWIKQYKQYHKEHTEYGNGGGLKFYLQHIIDLVQDTKSETLLDYGCGKGILYDEEKCKTMPINEKKQALNKPLQSIWKLDYFSLYDPAYPKHSK